MTCTMTDTIYKMNIYFCHEKNHIYGCHVAADTIDKARALYAKWDGMVDFTDCRGYVILKDVDVFAGVCDADCPELARALGLKFTV